MNGSETMTEPPDEWITIADAAMMLECTPGCVREYIRRGELEAQYRKQLRITSPGYPRRYKTYRSVLHVRRSDIEARDDFALVRRYPLDAPAAADQLGCSLSWSSTLMASGMIHAVKVHRHWRTDQASIDAYKVKRLRRRPGMDQQPIKVRWQDHNAPCARCLCAICTRLENCPVYAGAESIGQRKSGSPRLANRCSDPRYCANENGGARSDKAKEPLELRPRLTYEIGYGWMRHDDELEARAVTKCRYFQLDADFFQHKESLWSAVMRRSGLVA